MWEGLEHNVEQVYQSVERLADTGIASNEAQAYYRQALEKYRQFCDYLEKGIELEEDELERRKREQMPGHVLEHIEDDDGGG